MSFRPYHDDHAIIEVAFQVRLEQGLSRDCLDAISKSQEEWRSELPATRIVDVLPQPFTDLSGQVHMPTAAEGGMQPQRVLELASHRKDGSIEWRLLCFGAVITVNCGVYTRWNSVWERSRRLMNAVIGSISLGSNSVKSVTLQYTDAFVWEGEPDSYDASLLLQRDAPGMSELIFNTGPFWHLYQGWFSKYEGFSFLNCDLPDGKILERFHLDSVTGQIRPSDPPEQIFVRLENTLRYDFSTDVASNGLFAEEGIASRCFGLLHHKNKKIMKDFLDPAISNRVGLNVV